MTTNVLRHWAFAWMALLGTPLVADESETCTQETCGEYGTSVVFADSPADAARRALAEEKLVFVLHVSGNFEESQYT